MSYTRSKGLKEIFLGTKEASPNCENPPYPYGDYFVQFGGEGLDAFTRRIFTAVQEIAAQTRGQTILIVTHGMAIRRFLTVVPALTDVPDRFIGNCTIVKLRYENGSFAAEEIIDPTEN